MEGRELPSTSHSASLPLFTWFLSKQLLHVIMKMSFFFWTDSNLGSQNGIEFPSFFHVLCVHSEKHRAEKRFASFTTKRAPSKARSPWGPSQGCGQSGCKGTSHKVILALPEASSSPGLGLPAGSQHSRTLSTELQTSRSGSKQERPFHSCNHFHQ